MSKKYDEYLRQHIANVYNGFCWIRENIPDIFADDSIMSQCEYQCQFNHDTSKMDPIEYMAYDAYFYGYGNNRSSRVVSDFQIAWLHHIHNNPHHWQHWILNNDNPEEGEIILDMPDGAIIEMICDWWSFSWAKGNLFEIFGWYEQRKNYIKLSKDTREKVEQILNRMKNKLVEIESNKDIPDSKPNVGEAVVEAIGQNISNDMIGDLVKNALDNKMMNGAQSGQ